VRYFRISYMQGAGAAQMSFDRFYPSYGTDDGVIPGNTGLRVAYAPDDRTSWTRLGQTSHPDTTTLVSPPTQIRPDSVSPPLVLNSGMGSVCVALADTIGGVNPLGAAVQYTITAVGVGNGAITPEGAVIVLEGDTRSFAVTPAPYHELDSLVVDGVRVDSTSGYTFVNVTANHTIRAVFRLLTTTMIDVPLNEGWNLIANPVADAMPGDSVRQLFPTSVNAYAFGFGGAGYIQCAVLSNGRGYWGKFPAPATQAVTGTPRLSDTLAVVPGWNIVGTVTCPVDTGTIVSVPPGLRASSWFDYTAGYAPATVLVPGKGYWVKAAAAGRFVLTCPVSRGGP
jgi:hypothetical protein